MIGADLLAEYEWSLARTKPADLDPLQQGVGDDGLAIGPAVAPIRLLRDRLHFELDPDGDAQAFILPVRGDNPLSPESADPVKTVRCGPIVDLLAFSAAVPHRWALRTCAAMWLGAVEPQFLMPDPTPVWRTPLRWLANDYRGIVLLTRDRRDQYRGLTCCDSIVAEDERHADELRKLLAHPWLAPPVYVRRGREVARRAA